MKLYDTTTAPNPRRVRVFLAEKNIEVPMEQVDIAGKENRQSPFLEKNPLGGVPVLELDDGSFISESVAICRYFDALHPEPALFGESAEEQAAVEMWNRRMEFDVMLPILNVFRHGHPFFKGRIEQVPEYSESCRREAGARLSWLNGELANREFVVGDKFTIADITALCAVDFGKVSKIRMSADHEHLQAWHARVSARPSASA